MLSSFAAVKGAHALLFLPSSPQAAALSGARLAVATDGHPDVLEALAENVRRNGFELDGHGFGHRDAAAVGTSGGAEGAQRGRACISVRRLRWGDAEDVAAARGIAGPVRGGAAGASPLAINPPPRTARPRPRLAPTLARHGRSQV